MKSFRLLHVLLGAAVLGAYLTGEETGIAHAWIGYAAAALIVLRVALGLLRRSGFSFTRLMPRLAPAPIGMSGLRNPFVARTLTLALVLNVALSAATGVALDRGGTLVGESIRLDEEEDMSRGPGEEREDDDDSGLSASLFGLASPARADEGREQGGEDEGPLAELHEFSGKIVLPLAALHLLYMLLFRFDLARFMLFLPKRRTA